MRKLQLITVALLALLSSQLLLAANASNSVLGIQGYDPVSYHTGKRPIRGNGHFVSTHNEVTYQFANANHKALFDKAPEKYVPAYGGFCAFGVSVGKKFIGDPEVWRIVDGTVYLNLDANIQDDWLKDVPGKIEKANQHWSRIKDVPAGEL